jgi:hypothetical protein
MQATCLRAGIGSCRVAGFLDGIHTHMSVARALARATVAASGADHETATIDPALLSRVALCGIVVLVLVAPFEAIRPLMSLPGQSFSTAETVLLAVLAVCAIAAVQARAWTVLDRAEWLPWAGFVMAAALSAVVAPEFKANALHMAARVALMAAVWAVCVIGASTGTQRRRIAVAGVASGTIVAALVIADFAAVAMVTRFLSHFRSAVAIVGAQVRASGPFQYPTIASMFLEICCAMGLGLLVARDGSTCRRTVLLTGALALMVEGIVLTFTRAGLITVALSMLIVGALHWRRERRMDRASVALAVLGVVAVLEVLSSRSVEMLMLRLTSEGQGRWFSAVIEAPATVAVETTRSIGVPVTITNTGRATWDSFAPEPVRLSYHWIAEDSDQVIAWEGRRTVFRSPVRPGEQVSLLASVAGPGRPGRFRLMWDIEQQHRLWFSTEPDANLVFSDGEVTGPVTSIGVERGPSRIPRMAVRPGRLVLWRAGWRMFLERPLLGVGPDNYRLLYGRYSDLKVADARVHSNNMYVETLAGMGLAGASALLWVGVSCARAAWLSMQTSGIGAGIAAACAAIAVHGLVDAFLSFTGTYILIGVALGLATGCARDGGGHAHRL